jgi:membrane-associated phospholipid phosphatase
MWLKNMPHCLCAYVFKKTTALLILSFFTATTHSQNLDYKILNAINSGEHPQWDKAMQHVSDAVYFIGPTVPVAITLQGYFTKNKELLWNGYKSAISISAAMAISTALKYSIKRQRPYEKYPGDIIPKDETETPSFPSGHTTSAFATATSLSLTYKKWYVTVPAYLYAGLAGYSRMRLGMHYPSDVLGGAILGTGTTLLTWHLAKKISAKKNKPLPPAVE